MRLVIQRALMLTKGRSGENELVMFCTRSAGELKLAPTFSASEPVSCSEIVARRVFVTSAESDFNHLYESTVNAPTTAEKSAAC